MDEAIPIFSLKDQALASLSTGLRSIKKKIKQGNNRIELVMMQQMEGKGYKFLVDFFFLLLCIYDFFFYKFLHCVAL